MACSHLPCPLLLLCSLLMLPSGEGIPGGLSPISPTDKGVQEAAAFAVEKFNERINSAYYMKMLRVVKAEVQVVEGALYYLTVDLVRTTCEKHGEPIPFSEIQKCPLPPSEEQQKQICDFQIWSRPWLPATELTKMSCS